MTTGEIINGLRKLETELWKQALDMIVFSTYNAGMADAYYLASNKVKNFISHIENSFNNYYFTFGTWEGFPYQNTYLIVKANSLEEAIQKYEAKYPNTDGDSVLCAFYYTEETWDKQNVARYYVGQKPAEIIY